MTTTQPIKDKRQILAMSEFYLRKGQLRNHLLIVMGLYTALRVSDLLLISWDDVYDFGRGCVRTHIHLVEKKTRKPKTVALNKSIVAALTLCLDAARPGAFLFANTRTGKAISRIQAYRIIRDAGESLGLGRVSCHSLRKTLGYHALQSGIQSDLIMDLYNHSSLAVTRRYLGITQDDKDAVYLGLDLTAQGRVRRVSKGAAIERRPCGNGA
jgi:integrase